MSGKSHAGMRGFRMVLFTASRGNNFVGGTRALPSDLLVYNFHAEIQGTGSRSELTVNNCYHSLTSSAVVKRSAPL